MFSKFNLKLDNNDFSEYYSHGKSLFDKSKTTYNSTLEKFINADGIIDGIALQDDIFPINEHFDIFLSHSHDDEYLAISLAGYLNKVFNLKVFIDSCLWGYSNDLLNIIDKNYCMQSDGQTYDYNKRNYSTSHVHMMLSIALNNMIDKCEAIFFLNTPNSISLIESIGNEVTMSAWIYSELSAVQILRRKAIEHYRSQLLNESVIIHANKDVFESSLNIAYTVDKLIDDLTPLTKEDLTELKNDILNPNIHLTDYTLDYLYKAKNLITISKKR